MNQKLPSTGRVSFGMALGICGAVCLIRGLFYLFADPSAAWHLKMAAGHFVVAVPLFLSSFFCLDK